MATTTREQQPAGEEFRPRTRPALARDEVRRLSKLSPLRSTLSLLQTWGLLIASFYLAHRFPHPLVFAAAVLCIVGQQHALAILAHQSAHYRMYETRWLNDLVGRICGMPLGVSMITYRVIHRIHHNHLYSAIDPDLALMAGYPRGRAYLVRKLLKDLVGITTVKNYLYFVGKTSASAASEGNGDRGPLDDTSDALQRAARRDRWLVLLIALSSISVVILTGWWKAYLLLWVVPLVTLLQAVLRLRAICEHGAVVDTSDALRAARTTLVPWYWRWFLFPHDMNFHVEHHLYPSVPHYRLAECHRAMVAAGALDGAEVVPTLSQTLAKIFRDPTYAWTAPNLRNC